MIILNLVFSYMLPFFDTAVSQEQLCVKHFILCFAEYKVVLFNIFVLHKTKRNRLKSTSMFYSFHSTMYITSSISIFLI